MEHMYLLGAGASKEAGIPISRELTQAMLEHFESPASFRPDCLHIVRFVLGGLALQRGVSNLNPEVADIEELFSAIALLGERHDSESAPFVAAWHDMVGRLDNVDPDPRHFQAIVQSIYAGVVDEFGRSLPRDVRFTGAHQSASRLSVRERMAVGVGMSDIFDEVGKSMQQYVPSLLTKWLERLRSSRARANAQVGREFTAAIREATQAGGGQRYRETAYLMIEALKPRLWLTDDSGTDYLSPLLEVSRQQGRVTVATLNYDNTVELLARRHEHPVETGIGMWSQGKPLSPPAKGLYLLKLHGSIDWRWEQHSGPMDHKQVVAVNRGDSRDSAPPAIVFGLRNKLTSDGPFLDLLSEFRRELQSATILTVVGYSFRDAHVNTHISEWLNARADNRLRIVDPSIDANPTPYYSELRTRCAERVQLVQTGAGEGLASLAG